MDKIFFADITKDESYSYTDLIKDLNRSTYHYRFCYSNDFYVIFKNLLKRECIIIIVLNDLIDPQGSYYNKLIPRGVIEFIMA